MGNSAAFYSVLVKVRLAGSFHPSIFHEAMALGALTFVQNHIKKLAPRVDRVFLGDHAKNACSG
jgi:hypothetical protein